MLPSVRGDLQRLEPRLGQVVAARRAERALKVPHLVRIVHCRQRLHTSSSLAVTLFARGAASAVVAVSPEGAWHELDAAAARE